MIYRSKAPLRIGLAGGGTDVSPYSDQYGGAILNATISLSSYATVETLPGNKIIMQALDRNEEQIFDWTVELPIDGQLDLLKGVYNRLQKDFKIPPAGFRLSTYVDVPAGSGLGTSSTLVVAILGAFTEMFNLPLRDYDLLFLGDFEQLQPCGICCFRPVGPGRRQVKLSFRDSATEWHEGARVEESSVLESTKMQPPVSGE